MQFAGEMPARFMRGIKRFTAFFTGAEIASLRSAQSTLPQKESQQEDYQKAKRRNRSVKEIGEQMAQSLAEGLNRFNAQRAEEKKAAALPGHSNPVPKLPEFSEEDEMAIIRKMTFDQRCDYWGALLIEGLQRKEDMTTPEMQERKRQWEAKRAAFLSAIQALQQAPANPPTWAQNIVDQFQKDLRGE